MLPQPFPLLKINDQLKGYARLLGINVSGGANVGDILAVLPSGTGGDVARAAISKLGAPYVRGARGDDNNE